MNRKTAKLLRKVSSGNRQVYQALKREWATLTREERTARRLSIKAKAE